jgi:hypothetical protein
MCFEAIFLPLPTSFIFFRLGESAALSTTALRETAAS